MHTKRVRLLVLAFLVAFGLIQLAPAAAAAESSPESVRTIPGVQFRLTGNGLQSSGRLPDLRYLDWSPGAGAIFLFRVENQLGSAAAIRADVVNVRQGAGLADALRLTSGARSRSVADAQRVGLDLFTVPAGASEWTTMHLGLPTETSNSVQGGYAKFTIRLIAEWNGGVEQVDLPVGSPDSGLDSLALTGRDLLSWFAIATSLLVSGIVLRQRAGISATKCR